MYYVSRIASGFAVLTLFAAIWFSVRLAVADSSFHRGTPESVARAVEIMPRNAEYLVLRALQLEYDGQDSTALLVRTATLAPFASTPRIRLGLAAEVRGDYASAEKWLLEAASIDRQFEARWTLANYYFRRQNAGEFWKWMRAALESSYGDRRPVFELCWRMTADAQEILTRAIPDRRDVVAAYLVYLLNERRFSAAGPVSLKLAAARDPDDRALLFSACDALIDASDGTDARALWKAMGYPPPSGIVNGNFEQPRIGRGFDWRLIEGPGIRHLPLDPPGHRIVLSGAEAESSELLRQYITLQPRTRYILRWEVRMEGLATPTGIEWRIGGQRGPVSAGEFSFTAQTEIAPLVLFYQRPSGQTRAEGSVELRRVSLTENK